MIKIYFTNNDHEWGTDKLYQMLLPLPDPLKNKIISYRSWQEKQSRLLGKWLLLRLLDHFKLDKTLAELKYTDLNKPYISNFNFSTAHSGDMVICAASLIAEIGIDIEQIIPINLEDYQDQLTKNEWAFIQNSLDPKLTFYQIWTKKEALIKAIGRGIDINFATLDVCSDMIHYNGKSYTFYPLSIADGYTAHIATSAPFYNGSISSEMLSDLL